MNSQKTLGDFTLNELKALVKEFEKRGLNFHFSLYTIDNSLKAISLYIEGGGTPSYLNLSEPFDLDDLILKTGAKSVAYAESEALELLTRVNKNYKIIKGLLSEGIASEETL